MPSPKKIENTYPAAEIRNFRIALLAAAADAKDKALIRTKTLESVRRWASRPEFIEAAPLVADLFEPTGSKEKSFSRALERKIGLSLLAYVADRLEIFVALAELADRNTNRIGRGSALKK